ncbi:hypothetical protein GLOIN_2v1843805 [Rhizophagus clarus]|uniref:Uncharacterized protein n=1 Tax=Rhizophagus clarus TaxID=94130 RepID=A0A8H3KXQ8_9GLOM|nr:hypothetical protein GLOIN_2v1843805 [Rhizophagus clarus]
MNTSKSYLGQNERGSKSTYYSFLNVSYDILITSILPSILPSDTWEDLDTTWLHHFSKEAKLLFDQKTFITVKNRVNVERLSLFKISTTILAKGKKRPRDNDSDFTNSSTEYWKKQYQILEQKDNLVYKRTIDAALLVSSAHEDLITGDIIPFIKVLKKRLLARSQMSLASADEPVLQAIVENILPSNCFIPELSLVVDGKKSKGSSLVKNKVGANELEDLDKTIEKEDEKSLLKRPYSYWSKENKKLNKTTIGDILDNGINQLILYMKTISKGKVTNYSSSGVFDKRV